ncbi:hypothetical protein ISP17_12820 [Dyella ginsengisoli]|uniref:Uncharacterized protein n=1 Tax=Dyella ginsengisoli TaxID=363848 RepID=A0ABW8JWM3_9GAMM
MKKHRQQAAPQFTADADGNRLAHIALAHTHERATLYAEDYERVLAQGFSPYWAIASTGGRHRYVLVQARSPSNIGRSLTVARLVAQAGKGQRVGYADGDRLNLRRENLVLVKGPAKAAAVWLHPKSNKATNKPGAATPEAPNVPPIPSPPRAPFAPRVVDTAALGQRVRQQMAQQAREVTP